MAGYVWEKGRALDPTGNISVTLSATATNITGIKKGKSFFIVNPVGQATLYFGATSATCTIPLASGSKDGFYLSTDGNFYIKGTAGQTAIVQFVEDLV